MSAPSITPLVDAVMEEWYNLEIPCGGIGSREHSGPCLQSAAATLVSYGHGCRPGEAKFKCHDCHRLWAKDVELSMRTNLSLGLGLVVVCGRCNMCFDTVESFSHYRPF